MRGGFHLIIWEGIDLKLSNAPMIFIRTLLVIVAIMVLPPSHLTAASIITDDDCGFTLTLPDGFVPKPELVVDQPDIVHGFVLVDPTNDEVGIILLIEKLHGTIARERLDPEDMPLELRAGIFTTQWQDFDIDVVTVPEQLGELKIITYNVQIPLRRAAIQIRLVGPADRESELRSLLEKTIAGLEGESNWKPSTTSSASRAVESSRRHGIVPWVVAIVIVLGGLALLWLVSKKAPKGIVLAISVGCYFVGAAPDDAGERGIPFLTITIALKLLGIAGGILGIIDLFRGRRRRNRDIT